MRQWPFPLTLNCSLHINVIWAYNDNIAQKKHNIFNPYSCQDENLLQRLLLQQLLQVLAVQRKCFKDLSE